VQVDISKDNRALQKLRRETERAKRALSSQHQVRPCAEQHASRCSADKSGRSMVFMLAVSAACMPDA
jgi:molecular chaperone DnaK (HSP70)